MSRPPMLIVACLAGLACHGPDPSDRYVVERLPGGGRHVANSGRPAWSPATQWRLEPDLELGSPDGMGPETFGLVSALHVDSAGRMYVLDHLAQEVRVFDASGRFSHRMGGNGRGPGEFVGAETFYLAPTGGALVVDERTARYTRFGPDGGLQGMWPRQTRGTAPFGGFLSDGSFVDWGTSFPDEGPAVVAGRTTLFQPFRLSADFAVTDSLAPVVWQREMTADGRRPQVFFSTRLVGYQGPSGQVWFANTRAYEVIGRMLDGDTVLVFTLPVDPAEVLETDRRAVRERMASRPELLNQYLRGLPPTKPVIAGVAGDGAGHLYVVPSTQDILPGTALHVFRETGEFLGPLDLPRPMWMPNTGPVLAATPEHLYYVVADDRDVPRVVRLRIVRPTERVARPT